MEETRERIIFSCKNWGNENCNPEVGKHRNPKELKPGEGIPLWPVGEEQKRLDVICKICEFFELKPK